MLRPLPNPSGLALPVRNMGWTIFTLLLLLLGTTTSYAQVVHDGNATCAVETGSSNTLTVPNFTVPANENVLILVTTYAERLSTASSPTYGNATATWNGQNLTFQQRGISGEKTTDYLWLHLPSVASATTADLVITYDGVVEFRSAVVQSMSGVRATNPFTFSFFDFSFIFNGNTSTSGTVSADEGDLAFMTVGANFPIGTSDNLVLTTGQTIGSDCINLGNPEYRQLVTAHAPVDATGDEFFSFDLDNAFRLIPMGFAIRQAEPTNCEITNVQVTNLRCGNNGVEPGQTYADISFDVTGGSGDYIVLVTRDGNTTTANDPLAGLPMEGTVNTSGQLTFDPADPGDMVEIQIVDQGNGGCQSVLVPVTVLECPPCELECEENVTVELGEDGTVMYPNDLPLISFMGGCTDRVNGPFTMGGPDARTFDCADVGQTFERRMVYNAQDGSGEVVGCDYTVTVIDPTAPVLECEESVTVELGEDGTALMPNDLALISITDDNCPGLDYLSGPFTVGGPMARMFNCEDVGEDITRRLVFNDANGGGEVVGCDYTVVVVDNVQPEALCQDGLVELDEFGEGGIDAEDIDNGSNDACGIESLELDIDEFGCDDVGEVTVTLTVTDVNGNENTCTATVTVEDNVAPDAVCQDITVELDENGEASIATDGGGMGAADPITQVTGSLDDTDPQFERPNGNGTTCTVNTGTPDHFYDVLEFSIDQEDMYTFMMEDIVGPDFYFLLYEGGFDPNAPCDNFLIGNDDSPQGGTTEPEIMIQLMLVPGEYSLVTTAFFSGAGPLGPYTINISSDGGGNVLPRGAGGGSLIDGGSTDACGIASFSEDITEFTCADVGPNTVTLTVTDVNGNEDSCEATVTVEDNIDPEITTTPQTIVLDENGFASLTVADLASATDNCAVASLTASQLEFGCEDIGEVPVTITAEDVNGNVSTAEVIVTVDFIQPLYACVGELNLTLNENCQALLIPSMVLTGTEACLEVFAFDITVMDDDPSNGPIIDGCGSFQYMISAASLGDEPTLGFTGDFAPENWTEELFFLDGFPIIPEDAGIEFNEDEIVISTIGDDFGVNLIGQVSYTFAEDGEVGFDYDYNGIDIVAGTEIGFDDAFVVYTFEGAVVEVLLDTDIAATGRLEFPVEAGFTLFIGIDDDGFTPSLSDNPD
ncbi:hypothetical protein E1J53_0022470, partial [Lewinella sp. W8]